jgi:hypothetical protein
LLPWRLRHSCGRRWRQRLLLAQAGRRRLQPSLPVQLLHQAAQLHGVAGGMQPLQQLPVSQ